MQVHVLGHATKDAHKLNIAPRPRQSHTFNHYSDGRAEWVTVAAVCRFLSYLGIQLPSQLSHVRIDLNNAQRSAKPGDRIPRSSATTL